MVNFADSLIMTLSEETQPHCNTATCCKKGTIFLEFLSPDMACILMSFQDYLRLNLNFPEMGLVRW